MKKITLEETLDFINLNYLEDRLFIVVPHLYKKEQFEIMWHREPGEPRWLVKNRDQGTNLQSTSSNDLINVLNREKVDILEFHAKIIDKMLSYTAHLNMTIEKAQEVFGKDFVEEATINLKEFYSTLLSTIEETFATTATKNKKANLRL